MERTREKKEGENQKVGKKKGGERKTEERAEWKKSLESWVDEQIGRMAD